MPETESRDDRLVTCPECRSTFEAEDGTIVQHPAAPETETETDANRLTEAITQVVVEELGLIWPDECESMHVEVAQAVERIVAERVRVVEGERDAARVEACDLDHGWDDNPARVYGHYGSPRTCIRLRATDEWVYDPAWEDAR